mgnify:CR=1 FL=1
MATISFKTKAVAELNADGSETGNLIIYVPEFKRSHCDMNAFRQHRKYGAYANSDLFLGMLKRIRRDLFPYGHFKTNALPEGVTADTSKFMTSVTVEV